MLLHVHVQTAGLENQCMMILFYGYILSYIYIYHGQATRDCGIWINMAYGHPTEFDILTGLTGNHG